MDPISQFIADWQIPIGEWGKDFFDFLTTNFSWFFDRLSDGLKTVLEALIDLMLWIPPVVLVILIVALAWWLQKSWRLALAVAIFVLFKKLSTKQVGIVGICFWYIAAGAGGSWAYLSDAISHFGAGVA